MTARAPGEFISTGRDIRITSGAVSALAMTLYELWTNTTKFGALSTAAGRVDISWTIGDEKQRLRLTWTDEAARRFNVRHGAALAPA